MISEPNIEELLPKLLDIETKIESITAIPGQTTTPLTFHKVLPTDVQSELDKAKTCVWRARRLLMGLNTKS